ncbi:MAG: tRNA-dihydrouridine synthase family protein [Halobacteriovoraceae bacterium]|jgi:tRNA-dihydrouridine synthase B|nr:tRNA-dihydrouridine synthase family protein [Halobacteriovoraceae bacterium]MBT5092643.1 tRNA-dihydrouridine synthase family protein [Halobacteriovoraceae bacterium]
MYNSKSLLFAPMEGITDAPYRRTILELYPEWDAVSTDFLRIPSQGSFSDKKILQHWGQYCQSNSDWAAKTTFQILAPVHAQVEQTVAQIQNCGIHSLDLNLGCPSRKVNSHGGGAFLLSTIPELKVLTALIRKNFKGTFSVKMRAGFRDDKNLLECLKVLQEEGVEAITLHGRTRDQLYKGVANWDYIKQAGDFLTVPLIGNGDVWSTSDISNMYHQTDCHSIMIARGALKTPWLAGQYRRGLKESLFERTINLIKYFDKLEENYRIDDFDEVGILKRFKALSRYLFDPFPNSHHLKSAFLRSRSLVQFRQLLDQLAKNPTNPHSEIPFSLLQKIQNPQNNTEYCHS